MSGLERPQAQDQSKTQHHRGKLPAWVVLAALLSGVLVLEGLYFAGVIPNFPVGQITFLSELVLLVFVIMIVKSIIRRPTTATVRA